MGHSIHAKSAGFAWKKAVQLVLAQGKLVFDGPKSLREVLGVVTEVADPQFVDAVVATHGDRSTVEFMKKNFLGRTPVAAWGYSYGMRIRDFDGVDQFNAAIKKLQKNPETKSATMSFLFPPHDDKHMPCIVSLDFKVRRGKLFAYAFLRSHDALKKFYADVLALGALMRKAARQLHVRVGALTLFSVSLHVYEEDIPGLKSLFGRINK
ncbi:hypothetical protein HY086_02885 [Candidatus Gottesmanbacteria bacterium]|nr:hypothetical protein [Candidatus Gottesmanbacteria bacterium]